MILFLFGNLVYEFSMTYMMRSFLEGNSPRRIFIRANLFVWIAISLVLSGIVVWNFMLQRDELFVMSRATIDFATIVMSVVAKLLYRVTFIEVLFTFYTFSSVVILLQFFVETIIYGLLGYRFPNVHLLLEISRDRGIYLIVYSLIIVLLRRLYKRIGVVKKRIKFQTIYEIILIITEFLTLCIFQNIYFVSVNREFISWWIMLLMALVIFIGGGFLHNRNNKLIQREKMTEFKLLLMEKNYKQILDLYKEKSELLHDEKHHINAIQEMLAKGDIEHAKTYTYNILNHLSAGSSYINSGCELLNLVLNEKHDVMKTFDIKFDVTVDCMEGLAIGEIDVCGLFSNLLDNAIESNLKIREGERYTKLVLRRNGDLLIIDCKNPCTIFVGSNEKLKTTKKDVENHGFGLGSMKTIVEKYDGSLSYSGENGEFSVVILMNAFD